MKRVGLACACACAGCIPTSTSATGPNVSVTASTPSDSTSDSSVPPQLSLGTDASYVIAVEVDTMAGDNNGTPDPVKTLTVTTTLTGTTIPNSPYTPIDPSAQDLQYKRQDPIMLPSTAQGGMLAVSVDAVDGLGLHSNVVNFKIALRP